MPDGGVVRVRAPGIERFRAARAVHDAQTPIGDPDDDDWDEDDDDEQDDDDADDDDEDDAMQLAVAVTPRGR